MNIGVDVGGSWVRAVALDGGRVRARVRLKRAAAPHLPTFLRGFYREHGLRGRDVRRLVVAARGVWAPAERRALEATLAPWRLAAHVTAISDVEAAFLATFGPDDPGVLLLAGTGSVALGRTADGAWVRAGGLGPLLGDEGSGFWIGREWLRTHTPLARARALTRRPDAVALVAALARSVVRRARAGGRAERAVVRAAQAHLAALAADVARQVDARDVGRAGALLGDAWFRGGVARALTAAGVRARWREPRCDPALAAARLALD